MKILILANNAGGLYNFRAELLKTLLIEGYNVVFAVPQKRDHRQVRAMVNLGCQHIHTPLNRRGINPVDDLKLIKTYQRIIKETSPDLILSYTVKPNVYGNYAAARSNVPVIMNVTGIGSSLAGGKLRFLVKSLYRYACSRAGVIFFQNKSNLDFFLENKMVQRNKARLIPGSGVNLEKFKPLQKANPLDGTTRFLLIGRIMKDKGIEEYLKAAKIIKEDNPDTEFQILGSFEEEQYREIIENNPNVKYLGRSEDVREQIREVDCIVHPSYHEGMSNALLEGAAMGKPLLAANIPGCKEIVDDGVNGYLFEPRSIEGLVEKLRLFLSLEKSQQIKMGIESRKKVEREFDRNIVIKAYMQAIQEIIDRK